MWLRIRSRISAVCFSWQPPCALPRSHFLPIGFGAALHGLRHEFKMKLHGGAAPVTRWRPGCADVFARRFCSGVANAAAVVGCKNLRKRVVDLLNERSGGTEVGSKNRGFETQWLIVRDLKAETLDTRKELCIGVAEEVNGLHGIADDETRAARTIGPGSDQMREELMLAAARVLKFINQQMASAFGGCKRGVDRRVAFAFEDIERDLRDLNVIGGCGFCKNDAQFACGMAKQT